MILGIFTLAAILFRVARPKDSLNSLVFFVQKVVSSSATGMCRRKRKRHCVGLPQRTFCFECDMREAGPVVHLM